MPETTVPSYDFLRLLSQVSRNVLDCVTKSTKNFSPVTNSPRSTDTSFSSLAINVYSTIYRPLGSLQNGRKSGSEFKLACECFNELCSPIKPVSSQLSIGISPSSKSVAVPNDWSLGSFFLIAISASCVLTGAQYEWGMNPFWTKLFVHLTTGKHYILKEK